MYTFMSLDEEQHHRGFNQPQEAALCSPPGLDNTWMMEL